MAICMISFHEDGQRASVARIRNDIQLHVWGDPTRLDRRKIGPNALALWMVVTKIPGYVSTEAAPEVCRRPTCTRGPCQCQCLELSASLLISILGRLG